MKNIEKIEKGKESNYVDLILYGLVFFPFPSNLIAIAV